jgi:phosphoadenosine phosphosulfate reductase
MKEQLLFEDRDKIQIAITRIKEFEAMAVQNNPAGYFVCVSGGKDSSVIQELCIMARVKCEFIHHHTSVDHPETVYFIRTEQKRVQELGYTFTIDIPRFKDGRQKTMWNGILTKGLPTRVHRWCCERLKEYGGQDRYCITGVRWSESSRRAKTRGIHEISGKTLKEHIIFNDDNSMSRRLTEMCLLKRRFVLNPIVDWSDDDVWAFIKSRNLPINPLYAQGWRRVGCIGCPMSSHGREELDRFPKYMDAYFRAVKQHIEHRKEAGLHIPDIMETPEKYLEWWLKG